MKALIATVVLVGLTGCGTASSSSAGLPADERLPEKSALEKAYDHCEPDDPNGTLELLDDGEAMSINTRSIDTGGDAGIDGLVCVFILLDVPERIVTQMDSTTAMMGVRTATDDSFTYEWTYHPDNGLNVLIADEG